MKARGEPENNPLSDRLLDLHSNIIQACWEVLPGTNTLAYYGSFLIRDIRSLLILGQGLVFTKILTIIQLVRLTPKGMVAS